MHAVSLKKDFYNVKVKLAYRKSASKCKGNKSLIDLKTGECLMKDYMNRYSTVQISAWRKKWTIGFSSNPLDVKRKTR